MKLSLLAVLIISAAVADVVTGSTDVCPKVVLSYSNWFKCLVAFFKTMEWCNARRPCPSGNVCCPTACVSQCYALPQDKPGNCPAVGGAGPPPCGVIGGHYVCDNDADCTGNLKCCQTSSCGNGCVTPHLGPTTMCQHWVSRHCNNTESPTDQCQTNTQCSGKLLCCKNADCVKECTVGMDILWP